MVPAGTRGTGEVPAAPTPASQLGQFGAPGRLGREGCRGTWGQTVDSAKSFFCREQEEAKIFKRRAA